MTGESRDVKIRRMKIRSMRRGIREMDLVMSAFADARLATMPDEGLALYDDLLEENDQDLHAWITGQNEPPERFRSLLNDIRQVFQN